MSKDNTLRIVENPEVEPSMIDEAGKKADVNYQREWAPQGSNSNDSLSILYDFVPPHSFVLDVGCSIGQLGAALKKEKACRVIGLELNRDAARIAENVLDQVVVGDACTTDFVSLAGSERFDAVIFADVLEHIPDPESVLREASKSLSSRGVILISVPNVAHASVRLALLDGKFEYRTEGLLDKTHIKFYTRESIHQLLNRAGLAAVEVTRTYLGAMDTEIPITSTDFVSPALIAAVEGLEEATTYQFVIKAVPLANEYYHELVASRLNNLENTVIGLDQKNQQSIRVHTEVEAFREAVKNLGEKQDLLSEKQEIAATALEQMQNRLNSAETERDVELARIKKAMIELTGAVQARLSPLEEQNRLTAERVERYINIWPLRVLRGLRKRVLRV